MRERRYWYLAAILVLVGGGLLGWRHPGICRTYAGPYGASGCGGFGVIIGVASVAVAVILAFVGFLRDPD